MLQHITWAYGHHMSTSHFAPLAIWIQLPEVLFLANLHYCLRFMQSISLVGSNPPSHPSSPHACSHRRRHRLAHELATRRRHRPRVRWSPRAPPCPSLAAPPPPAGMPTMLLPWCAWLPRRWLRCSHRTRTRGPVVPAAIGVGEEGYFLRCWILFEKLLNSVRGNVEVGKKNIEC